MWKSALAGAIALATLGSLSISFNGVSVTTAVAQDVVITESHITRLKRSLRLTPAQMVHWHKVEAALRNYLSRAASTENSEGSYYQRARARIAGYALNAAAKQRLSSAAGPLIATLDEDQKRDGMQAIRAMGLASMF
jgi:hypothetical protein